jgi:hypothetical protein
MEENNDKPVFFALPYAMTVSGQEQVRPKEDFWRLRVIATVLRQTPAQIKSFKERYNSNLN